MKNVKIDPAFVPLEEEDLKTVNGGWVAAIGVGIAAMVLAYTVGKDVGRMWRRLDD